MNILVVNLILFLYQFEFIGYEGLSVYRCLIFPILVYGIFKSKIRIREKEFKLISFIIILFVIRLISSFYYDDYWALIDITGQAVQFIFIYNFLQKYTFNKSTLLILSTWSIFHLICFSTGTDTVIREFMGKGTDIGGRFCGFHWDPNYLCAYLLVAMWAKVYLLKTIDKFYLKVVLIVFIMLDISMVFGTLSKGGFLSLILTVLFYFIVYNKKIAIIIVLFISSFLIYAGSIYTQLGWNESSFVNRMIYRFFTHSVEAGDYTTGRSAFYRNYFDMIIYSEKGIIIGIPEDKFVNEFNNNAYPHSLIIGFWLLGGFIFGSLFLFILFCIILKECLFSVIFKSAPFILMFSLVFFFVFFNLSIGGLKFTWFFIGALFALSNKETFKIHIENAKTLDSYPRL